MPNNNNICLFLLAVSLAIAYGQDDLNDTLPMSVDDLNATDPVITNDENGTSILLANSAPYNDSIPVKNGMLSIVEELFNWYIPDSIPANNDADVVPPHAICIHMQYALLRWLGGGYHFHCFRKEKGAPLQASKSDEN